MTEQGFRARIYSVEWHCNLWRPFCHIEHVEAVMRHCSEVVEADYYGMDRPAPETGDAGLDSVCTAAERYFDKVFSSPGPQSFD